MARERKNTAIYVAFDDSEPLDLAQPEKNLLKAILLTAMADLKKQGAVGRKAMEYFLSPEDDYLFSFRSVCAFLEVDAERILKVIGLRRGEVQEPLDDGRGPIQ
ncbi:MAG: hypothetical protein J5J00_14135 [Deltaproteobacteria bacterium]|nr:hypothetical protein [Deltaproteobacteria bacterium]